MIVYQLLFDNSEVFIQPGWSIAATANGRNTMQCEVVSVDASYRASLNDPIEFYERATVVSSSAANPTIIEVMDPLGVITGETIGIGGHSGSSNDGAVNAYHTATRIDPTHFSIPINLIGGGGTGGWAGRRLFGGTISQKTESGLGDFGVIPIKTRIDGVDYSVQAERRYVNTVLAAGTLESILNTIASLCDFNIHPNQATGPSTSEPIVCEYALVREVLEKLSLMTGYTWAWNEHNWLLMELPNTIHAPINVITGNGVAIGDIVVEPSTTNYANRVILRYSNAATYAYGYLLVVGEFSPTDTVTIGNQTYTFYDTLPVADTPGAVEIGGNIPETIYRLARAITCRDGWGVFYWGTTPNSLVWADGYGPDRLLARALLPGAQGNSIACATTNPDAVWHGEGYAWHDPGMDSLALGADSALTKFVQSPLAINEPSAEQTAMGIWEIVVSSPETTDQALAQTLANAYLATKVPIPNTVKYDTYQLGLRPGQTQTITVAARDIDGDYLITEVNHKNIKGNLILRSVTAIESLYVQATQRWRDVYKQWSKEGLSSSSGSISGGGTTGGGTTTINNTLAGAVVISMGGSRYHAVQL